MTGKGNEKTIRWHNSIIRDDVGQIIGTLSSGEDITERKAAEEEVELLPLGEGGEVRETGARRNDPDSVGGGHDHILQLLFPADDMADIELGVEPEDDIDVGEPEVRI